MLEILSFIMTDELRHLQNPKNPRDSALTLLVFLHHIVQPGKLKKNNANLNSCLTIISASHPSLLYLMLPVHVATCYPACLYKRNAAPSDWKYRNSVVFVFAGDSLCLPSPCWDPQLFLCQLRLVPSSESHCKQIGHDLMGSC